jgi:hypothetical protein
MRSAAGSRLAQPLLAQSRGPSLPSPQSPRDPRPPATTLPSPLPASAPAPPPPSGLRTLLSLAGSPGTASPPVYTRGASLSAPRGRKVPAPATTAHYAQPCPRPPDPGPWIHLPTSAPRPQPAPRRRRLNSGCGPSPRAPQPPGVWHPATHPARSPAACCSWASGGGRRAS